MLTEIKNYSKLQPLQLYVTKRYTVCINISDLWLGTGLGLDSHGPRPRLHLHVHFAGQNNKILQNIIVPDPLFLYVGQPIKKFGGDRESNMPYLSVFPICSVTVSPLEG